MTSTALASLRSDAVSDWEACADAFYCEEHLYDLTWEDVDLDTHKVAAAPFGGPVAVVRDEESLVVIRGGSTGGRPLVRIFSASGQLQGSFLWEGGRLLSWGWSNELELVMVDVGAKVYFYSMTGARVAKQVSFGPQLEGEGISQACIYPDGLVVLGARSNQLWAVVGLQDPRAVRLPALPGVTGSGGSSAAVSCLAVLEPQFTLSSGLEVLAAVGETVWVVDDHGATDQPLPAGCGGVASMAVSPNGAFLAMPCLDGKLRVMSSDFSQQLSEFDSRSGLPPSSLCWCGVDAVALRWEGLLLLVGPYGDWLKRACEGPHVMVPEVDGLRLITGTTMSLLRRVPDVLVQVYKPGSTAAAAQLLDARDLFDAGSARSDKLLRQLTGQLDEAVVACATAAGLDLSVLRQRALLRAAVFGRAFASHVPRDLLRSVAVKLRLLNALREPDVGLPLTMPQLDALSLPVVVSRLVLARRHLMAYRVAEALGGAGKEEVLLHWAAAKISASPSVADGALKEALSAKISLMDRPKYAPLAAHAQSVGRRSLAIKLLEEEPSAAQQVPLLISLAKGSSTTSSGQSPLSSSTDTLPSAEGAEDTLSRALRKAVDARDPDLVYLALFAAYRSRPLPEFWKMVGPRPTARNLFVKYTRVKEPELLETLYITQQMAPEAAELALETALRTLSNATSGGSSSSTGGARPDAAIASAISGLQEASQKYGQCRDMAWQAKAAAEAALLLKEQLKLERDTGQALFVGLSLADTLTTCFRLGHARAAASLRKTFSVPEARWYWLKLTALAAAHDWEGLDAFAAERRSPIGWEPFLQAAAQHGAPQEVQMRLIARMPDSTAKAEAYNAINCPREAAAVAAALKDMDLFARIQGAVNANSPAGLGIAQIKERFWASTSFK